MRYKIIILLVWVLSDSNAQTNKELQDRLDQYKSLISFNSDTSRLLAKRDTSKFALGIKNSISTNISYVFSVLADNNSVNPSGSTPTTASDFMTIFIPSAGTWMIDWSVVGIIDNLTFNTGLSSVLTDNSNIVISDPIISVYSISGVLMSAAGNGKWFVNVSSPSTYKIRVFGINTGANSSAISSSTIGRSWISALKLQ